MNLYKPNTTWTWSFLIIALVQTATILAMETYVFSEFQESLTPNLPKIPQVKTIPTYLTIFIFGFLYQCVLVYDSLRLKNTIQVIGLCLYNIGMLTYAAVQFDQIKKAIYYLHFFSPSYILLGDPVWDDVQPYLIAVPCVIALGTVVMSYVTWKLYAEFTWTIYKHISADKKMKQRFLTFQIYIALLKFDFFFFLGFTVQFLVIVTNIGPTEFGLTTAAIPVTIAILLLAAFFTRRENLVGMVFIMILYFGGLAYFIFKLVRIYQPQHVEQYLPVQKSLTIFAVLTIVLIVLTIINTLMCIHNFGKGLKPFILKRKIRGEEEDMELLDAKHILMLSRMTID